MRYSSLFVAAALLSASVAAKADDLFTFTSTSGNVTTFTLPATFTGVYTAGFGFVESNVAVTSNGVKGTQNFTFYDLSQGGGFMTTGLSDDGAQLYTVTNGTPTFTFGNYNFTRSTAGTLAITNTPEPSSFVLLGTGVLGVLGAAKRRFLA